MKVCIVLRNSKNVGIDNKDQTYQNFLSSVNEKAEAIEGAESF